MLDVRVLMRKSVLIPLIFLSSCATPNKDFRALNFGEDCGPIFDFEFSQNSLVLDDHKVAPTFQNKLFGHTAVFSYICSPIDGKLLSASGSYHFISLKEAVEYYDNLEGQLVTFYGEPVIKAGKDRDSGPGARFEGENVAIVISVMDPPVYGTPYPDGVDVAITYEPLND